VQVQVAHFGGLDEEVGVGSASQPAAHPVRFEIKVGQDPSDLGGADPVVGQMLGQQSV
jgi:hypothetical protein